MRLRGLLIAAVLLAVLGGTLYWSNKVKSREASKPLADTTPKLLSIPEDQFRKIEIRKTGTEGPTVLQKDQSDKWEITAPQKLPADQDALRSMVSTLSSLNSDRLIEEKASDLGAYGLASPSLQVTVTKKDGKSEQLLIGDDTPTGSGSFAKLQGDPRVFTIASYNKSSVDKTIKDLRDKRLLTFDSDKLLRVELTAKGQTVEFSKNAQNEWQILKPRPLRADSLQVEELIRKLKDAKMDTSASDEDAKKAVKTFSGGAQVAVVKVTDSSGTQEIQVRKDKDKNYAAKSSVVEGIYKVTSDLGDGLDKSLDDFRNKKLFDFGWNDPTRIEVRQGGAPVVYEKSGEKWMSASKQMDSTSMQTLVDKLRDLTSTKFVEKGFTTPILEVTVTSNEGKRVEKVAISKTGNDCFAKRENELTIYQLDPKVFEELQKALGGVKEAAPPAKTEKKK
jgi:hypothetical protein